MISQEQLKQAIQKGFNEGFLCALNGVIKCIESTGETEAVISVQLLNDIIKFTKESK